MTRGRHKAMRLIASERIAQCARTRMLERALPSQLLGPLHTEALVAHAACRAAASQATWWCSLHQLRAPRNVLERALGLLLKHACGGDVELEQRISGAEWWVAQSFSASWSPL